MCRIHENPLGDEGIEKLVSGLLALHGAEIQENGNRIINEPASAADDTTSDQSRRDHAESTVLNGSCTNQPSGEDNLPALKSLEIGACDMTTVGARAVARLIRANIGITSLSLTGNKQIDANGWAEIADSLEQNTTITTLELHHNGLENISTGLITDALARNTSIHTVDLEGNRIGNDGAEKIRQMLEVNTTLHTIHLHCGNQISESVLDSIEHLTAERQDPFSAT